MRLTYRRRSGAALVSRPCTLMPCTRVPEYRASRSVESRRSGGGPLPSGPLSGHSMSGTVSGRPSIAEGAGAGRHVDRALTQGFDGHDLKRPLVRRSENHVSGRAVAVRAEPVHGGHAPAVGRAKTRETEMRHPGDEIV